MSIHLSEHGVTYGVTPQRPESASALGSSLPRCPPVPDTPATENKAFHSTLR